MPVSCSDCKEKESHSKPAPGFSSLFFATTAQPIKLLAKFVCKPLSPSSDQFCIDQFPVPIQLEHNMTAWGKGNKLTGVYIPARFFSLDLSLSIIDTHHWHPWADGSRWLDGASKGLTMNLLGITTKGPLNIKQKQKQWFPFLPVGPTLKKTTLHWDPPSSMIFFKEFKRNNI